MHLPPTYVHAFAWSRTRHKPVPVPCPHGIIIRHELLCCLYEQLLFVDLGPGRGVDGWEALVLHDLSKGSASRWLRRAKRIAEKLVFGVRNGIEVSSKEIISGSIEVSSLYISGARRFAQNTSSQLVAFGLNCTSPL